MQGSVELSPPKDGLHTSFVKCMVLHEGHGHEKEESKGSHSVPVGQRCSPIGTRTDDNGQQGRDAEVLGSGLVCVAMCPTSLIHERCIAPWALHLCTHFPASQ